MAKEEKKQPKGIVALRRNKIHIDGRATEYTSALIKDSEFTPDEIKEIESMGLGYQLAEDKRVMYSAHMPTEGIYNSVDYMKRKCPDCEQTQSLGKYTYYIKFFSIFAGIAAIIWIANKLFM